MPQNSTGPGHAGSTQGQIQTPMSDINVGNKGGGKTHDYSKARGAVSKSANKGGDNLIEGPGVKGTGPAPTKSGSNKPGAY